MRDSDVKKWKNIIEQELNPALYEGLSMEEACSKIGYTKANVYRVIKTLGLRIEYVDLEDNPTEGKRLKIHVPYGGRGKNRVFKEVQVRKIRIV